MWVHYLWEKMLSESRTQHVLLGSNQWEKKKRNRGTIVKLTTSFTYAKIDFLWQKATTNFPAAKLFFFNYCIYNGVKTQDTIRTLNLICYFVSKIKKVQFLRHVCMEAFIYALYVTVASKSAVLGMFFTSFCTDLLQFRRC